ncbi:serine/threonine protein kinase [Vanrija albida]|uniref:non-specific serine/threonine protein kinase n=1 Tax=Vanrija albida TaxID=181172 RepID=A0ABR3PS49_9TREE
MDNDDDDLVGPAPPFRKDSSNSSPSSPTAFRHGKARALSADDMATPIADRDRERRASGVSTHSNGSAQKKPSLRDYILGEELGRGSYSTVVEATLAPNSALSASSRGPRRFAIKIMNQAHLVQENKIKYAHIERDALIRLSMPRHASSPRTAHRRGMSNSSSGGQTAVVTHKKSAPSISSVGSAQTQKRRNSSNTTGPQYTTKDRHGHSSDGSPISPTTSLSPLATTSILVKNNGDQQEFLEERSPEMKASGRSSNPPSPVKEEPGKEGELPTITNKAHTAEPGQIQTPPMTRRESAQDAPNAESQRNRTPRKRRQSGAPSDRSVRSSAGTNMGGHPGIIRLYCTFADKTSVYYVLELASHGELAAQIRKFGSLDISATKYYAALLIDTIEFMHDRDIIHRDLKPENILLDDDMRIKVTDFGSAKILNRKDDSQESSKRSFVGSADYVSPEVLRNEPASKASDIWAFGVVLYDFIVGKSPFRSATEYLTFQKVLSRDLYFPDGFDPKARSLIELLLNLSPTGRPTPQLIKAHPFFEDVDWNTIWTIPAPPIHTGLSPPVQTLAQVTIDSDVWAAFESDASDGEFDDEERPYDKEPRFDRLAAANAVEAVDHPGLHLPSRNQTPGPSEDLNPPRRAWLDEEAATTPPRRKPKTRGWSTSSSSSGGRLSGLLESMGINPPFTPTGRRAGSGHHSRMSDRSEDQSRYDDGMSRTASPDASVTYGVALADNSQWLPILFPAERVVLSTPILVRSSSSVPLPTFLMPASKRRQLILTDFPRLLVAKDDSPDNGGARTKHIFTFLGTPTGAVTHPPSPSRTPAGGSTSGASLASGTSGPTLAPAEDPMTSNVILDLQEKGRKEFVLQTATQTFLFVADTPDIRAVWMHTLKRVVWPRWSPAKRRPEQ